MEAGFELDVRRLAAAVGGPCLLPDTVRSLQRQGHCQVDTLMELLVPLAAERAVAPISQFAVGAVGLGTSGAFYLGANVELAGGPLGDSVHAEQAVVAAALAHDEPGLIQLAVSAPPCGHCRQFLWELSTARQLSIRTGDAPSELLSDLLPRPFGPADLDQSVQSVPLLGHANAELEFESAPNGPAAKAAAEAAARCYAPYTGSLAGIGLATSTGVTVAGSYIENAAYNPSLSPVLAAYAQLAQHGLNGQDIAQAVLVRVHDSVIDHDAWARRLLANIAPNASLEIVLAQGKVIGGR